MARTRTERSGNERRACGVLVALLIFVLPAPAAEEVPTGKTFRQAAIIELRGPITPLTEHAILRKLATAKARGADLVIVEIDSPGGFVDSSFNLANEFRGLDWATTVAFVPREALSGAAIASLGCDEIVMAPSAVLGDAGPIFQGEDGLFQHAPQKIRSDIAAKIRELAKSGGRSPALAEAMVDMNLVVFEVRNRRTGEKAFMSDAELQSAADRDDWEKLQPVHESRPDHFLEVTGTRAVELGLAEATAAGRREVLDRYGVAGKPIVLAANGVDTAVFILNLPIVTGLLFVIGLVALYVEISAPGISVGGLIATLCFALFFWSRFLGGTAGVLEIMLFLMGVVFLLVEILVLPGFGVAGLTGLLLMLIGVVLASQDFVLPGTGRQLGTFATSLLVVACSGAVFLIAAAVLSRHFGSLPLLSRLALAAPQPELDPPRVEFDAAGKPLPKPAPRHPTGVEVGDWGVAESTLRPAGKARFGDHFLDVLADGSFIDRGRQVRIVDIRGSEVVVRDVNED